MSPEVAIVEEVAGVKGEVEEKDEKRGGGEGRRSRGGEERRGE